jgi:hypothetical protein
MPGRKVNVRFVKFSSEELATEPPKEVNFRTGIILRGVEQWKQFLSFKRGYVKLDPKLRKQFKDPDQINQVLRQWVESKAATGKKRKSA